MMPVVRRFTQFRAGAVEGPRRRGGSGRGERIWGERDLYRNGVDLG
jgi:hypothetical protein